MKYLFVFVTVALFQYEIFCISKIRPLQPKRTNRVINGHLANISFNPSTASLVVHRLHPKGYVFKGGATLISMYWVVTAAHCIDYMSDIDIKEGRAFVRSNSTNWRKGYTQHRIARAFVHEKYSSRLLDNDIALLKVVNPFDGVHEQSVRVAVGGYDYDTNSVVTILGWGTTSPKFQNADAVLVVDELRYARIRLVDFDRCRNSYKKLGLTITERMVCAILKGVDACVNDSGGPLFQFGVLVGIVSWGTQVCGSEEYPGVYTRISKFYDWIQDTIRSNTVADLSTALRHNTTLRLPEISEPVIVH